MSRVARIRSTYEGPVSDEREQFLAAYLAWEGTAEVCYARFVDGTNGDQIDFEESLRDLQRLHREWLDQCQPLMVSTSADRTQSPRSMK